LLNIRVFYFTIKEIKSILISVIPNNIISLLFQQRMV